MADTIKVSIIGDYNPGLRFHAATNEALSHAAEAMALALDVEWLPTPSVADESGRERLEPFDALWGSPGSPYQSMDGELKGSRFARGTGRPFMGT